MVREVNDVSYNPDWPEQFQDEANRITDSLGDIVNSVHQIGSTTILGMDAKPIIDILLVVMFHAMLDVNEQALGVLGYLAKGENGIPGRRYFFKQVRGCHQNHLHAFEESHPEIERHLLFRGYLRCHPKDAQAYGELKQRFAAQFPFDLDCFTEVKTAFIREIDQCAAEWQLSL